MNEQTFTVDNAIILAAGFASRFAPLSNTTPKALLKVRGDILIERQIKQLQEANIKNIYIVTGYLHEKFQYLKDSFHVELIYNPEYDKRNNHSSIWAARDILNNSYICSSDNFFSQNVFSATASQPFYSALYSEGNTPEYCLTTDDQGRITVVKIGGCKSWYMFGHVLWNGAFSQRFLSILEKEYDDPKTKGLLWENIYLNHLHELTLYIKKYPSNIIYEFDSLDELCEFDSSYIPYRDSLSHK